MRRNAFYIYILQFDFYRFLLFFIINLFLFSTVETKVHLLFLFLQPFLAFIPPLTV